MSQHDKGSSHQLLNVIVKDPKIIFSKVESELKEYGVHFDTNEYFVPNQSQKEESIIEDFIKENCSKFPNSDLNSLYNWWAKVKQKPFWDFISTCSIDGTKGILLVEAKSHSKEMETGGKTISANLSDAAGKNKTSLKSYLKKLRNHDVIGNAISEARGALSNFCDNISISRNDYYQLSNRIAYTWKLASIGIPTILLYLGFTNDPAWLPDGNHFESKEQWNETIQNYFAAVGAEDLLSTKEITLNNGTSMYFCTETIEAE